ncbi:MAG: 2-oxoglutarate dehydrogenase E1 component [Gammaproteobacteria bacterium]|nr:2-oxoglutarate dehydrogenase E1 component [Gammaproteobacteria bacterium]
MKTTDQSWLFSANASFVEGLYESYQHDPDVVPAAWRSYFDGLEKPAEVLPRGRASAASSQLARPLDAMGLPGGESPKGKQVSVLQLINSYRFLGHRRAKLDPLQQHERPPVPELGLEYHRLSDADRNATFNTGSLHGLGDQATLQEIMDAVKSVYCGTIGSEYMHITDTEQKRWIQRRLETMHVTLSGDEESKRHILGRLVAGKGLEEYLHKRYVGQKRFSLEGGVSLIPLLDSLIERSTHHGAKEVIVGMAHRGRLNVLVNIFGKSTELLFEEFEGITRSDDGSGDVKYHKGFSSDLVTKNGAIHVVLAFNPSHLEVIDPVVEGSVRARQEHRGDKQRNQVIPVLIHGDAAFAGQGVVMETFNLSQTRGYTTGGTMHIIVNNQIGFTTSDPLDSRSSLYCTDVAKMVQAPIFHVNAEDPEAVVFVTQLALDYRMRFNKDVVVDMICFRRHGHSEADEPMMTQPIMYQRVKDHLPIREAYAQRLIDEGVIDQEEFERMKTDYQLRIKNNYVVSAPVEPHPDRSFDVSYNRYMGQVWTVGSVTRLARARIKRLAQKLTQLPEHFSPHPRVAKLLRERRLMGEGKMPMDWGFAENLAYASLLEQGYAVRLSGQDSVRGTFAHRHCGVHDQVSGEVYIPLQHLSEQQPQFLPINSSLSEMAVLGYEVGYSTAEPEGLVIWEAQFGDFANNAQVVIDQFISSSESKWQRLCGLTVLLPHGYDGQGPEHSSARLERYLQLCAEENIQVCMPSTPAQMFHMLRRQMLRPHRKPLIVMSPKSLLRHRLSVSSIDEVSEGAFRTVIDEIDPIEPEKVTRLLLCSGKVYFDLLDGRRENRLKHIAIVRIEQLYPFPAELVKAAIEEYSQAKDIVWVQEEPRNQGAWYYMQSHRHLKGCVTSEHRLKYVGRGYSASPAVGYLKKHRQQQKDLVEQALQLTTKTQMQQTPEMQITNL